MELGFGKRRVMEFGAKIGKGDGEAFMITGLSERERERVKSLNLKYYEKYQLSNPVRGK